VKGENVVDKTIVVLEDDYFDREWIGKFLAKQFRSFKICFLKTEAEFHAAFQDFIAVPPSLVLIDVRLPWTEPAPVMPEPPAEVLAGTYREAGFRCWKMLRQNKSTDRVPIIFYTGIDEHENAGEDVVADRLTKFVEKDITDNKIVREMRQMLRAV
jgi:CheY-like chemotaxis protein